MSTLVKRILIGIVLGILTVFAVVGVKSTLKKDAPISSELAAVTAPKSNSGSSNATPPITAPSTTPPKTGTGVDEPTEAPSIVTPDTPANTPEAKLTPARPEVIPMETTPPSQIDEAAVLPSGKLRLVLMDPADLNNKPKADFIVRDSQGVQVAMQQDTDVAIFDLPPGAYQASVSINGKRNTRSVKVEANRSVLENFVLPPTTAANPNPVPTGPTTTVAPEGTLQVIVKASGSSAPVKANIYVQKINGVSIASKTYTPGADFLLEPGRYKVTVKAKDKVDLAQEISVTADKITRATFNLQSVVVSPPVTTPVLRPAPLPNPPQPTPPNSSPVVEDMETTEDTVAEVIDNTVSPMENNNTSSLEPAAPPTHRTERPRRQFEPGSEVDTIEQPVVESSIEQPMIEQPIIEPPRAINRQGGLELHAVSGMDGSPLPVDFTVTTLRGEVLRRFTGVGLAEMALPAQDVFVAIHYRGMNGRETIRVRPGAPTVYTFTITPNTSGGNDLTN